MDSRVSCTWTKICKDVNSAWKPGMDLSRMSAEYSEYNKKPDICGSMQCFQGSDGIGRCGCLSDADCAGAAGLPAGGTKRCNFMFNVCEVAN